MSKQINVRVPDIIYDRLMTYVVEQEITQKQAIVDAINNLLTQNEVSLLRQELQTLKMQVETLAEREHKVG